MIAPYQESSLRWTVLELLRWTERFFAERGLESPRLDAELLLAHALGSTRLELYTEYAKLVEPEERGAFRELVKRRARREPVAYLTGIREFYSLAFEVTPDVLIPRPETEHLVDVVLERLVDGEESRLLDLGTGSGNIAITLAVNAPQVTVDAVEISEPALQVALRNASRHGVEGRVRCLQGDLFAPLEPEARYRAVVSNPPYIAADEFDDLMEDVRRYEPRAALLDGHEPGDGLGFYRVLASRASQYLEPDGFLAVEVGHQQAVAVADCFRNADWQLVTTVTDYGSVDRVLLLTPSCGASATSSEAATASSVDPG